MTSPTSPTSSTSSTPTGAAISPDSGEHWAAEGAWQVADGIHRIPLPLPMDGLKAINVYVVEGDDGLTLIDGGWAIPVARELLDRSLKSIGAGFGDIKRFLVTHIHRDHYTMASVLGGELGIPVALGKDEKPGLDLLNNVDAFTESPFLPVLRSAGAFDVAEAWAAGRTDDDLPVPEMWRYPDQWLEGDTRLDIGTRTIDAVHTPGHTPGHFVYAEQAAGLLFAGDHVLPTITPSIGFTVPPVDQPLGDFMASLAKVRSLPDLQILPAHGPVAPSSYARVDELLIHHETRLDLCRESVDARGDVNAEIVARDLGWTRHERSYADLDIFNQGMAAMETKAHLDLLVARGQAVLTVRDGVSWYQPPQ
ncbi:MAG TPA: MBL fold metallo-hydrolase [Nocardioides sp.]|nr:MBL fold metallo-hydrolase [Nocardioides sp.]